MRAPVRALLGSVALAVLLHWALLGEWAPGFLREKPPERPVPEAVQVRVPVTVPSPPVPAAPPEPAAVAPPPPTPPVRATPPAVAPSPAPRRAVAASAASAPVAAASTSSPVEVVASTAPASAASAAPSPAASAPASATPPPGERLPVYATRLPPPFTLRYGTTGGALNGSAELVWRPEGPRYEASLTMSVMGFTALTWRSFGHLDAHGVAPDRFTDLRRRRSEQAANFRRDSGRITFSGPATEYPLHPGTQDRLTWLIQVPGIVAAAPQRFVAGRDIRLFVSGARGDADVWVLHVHAPEAVTLRDGREIAAVRLSREVSTPYGTEAEIWLDPTHHHLPVRVRIGEQTLELLEGLPPP